MGLDRAYRRISLARKDPADVLKSAGREPLDGDDPDDDEELAFAPAWLKRAPRRQNDPDADRRRRELALARMRLSPDMLPSAAELERMRFIERARRGP